MSTRALVVEDDASVREIARLILEGAGIQVAAEADGEAGLSRFRDETFDVVVLDVMLPGVDGLEVCRRIRSSSQTPIVMVSARDDTSDVVAGLELGADDYVTKPFQTAELVARVRAVLRRTGGGQGDARLAVGDLEIDPAAFAVAKRGETVALSTTEFRLLVELVRHPRTALTRHELLRRVWDYTYMGDSRMVDMAVKRLRDRIEDDPHHPRWIATVRGVGYRFDP